MSLQFSHVWLTFPVLQLDALLNWLPSLGCRACGKRCAAYARSSLLHGSARNLM